MSKKASAQQKKNETHCKELCERIQRDGEALLDRHSKAAASVLESHRRQSEDLEEHEARILRQFAEEADRYAVRCAFAPEDILLTLLHNDFHVVKADQESLRKAYEEGVLARKALDQELSNWMDDMVELAFRQTDETANLCPPEAPSLAIGNVPKKRKMVGRLQ
ncbi:hypothetical protein HKX48_004453 [Thoreauomyces humboldtii]|nr:hypothetical protein HKX48_004453 [Thoreauomyces humboldtii]